MEFTTGNILLIGAVLLFVSVLVSKAGSRFGVPALLLFLGLGMVFGADGLGIEFNNPGAAQFIGMIALSIILFTGGMGTSFTEIKPVVWPGVVLATAGVFLTTVITGFFVYYLVGFFDFISLSLAESMLLAAVMSSTDSASVFSLLREKGVSLREKLRPTLELESGSNDPMAYMLTVLLIEVVQSGGVNAWSGALTLIMQLSLGSVAGFLFGKAAVWIINRINIDNPSLYPVLLLAFVFMTFSLTNLVDGNGYLAVYIAGLVVGNSKIVHKKSTITFFNGFTWLFQIVMFLALGLLVAPRELGAVAGAGVVVAFFVIIFARPITVFLCLLPFRNFSTRARTYVSWMGLKGAVPIIFATYPLMAGTPNAQFIFNMVFFITLVSLLVQGTTVGQMARWLKVASRRKPGKVFGVELPDEIKSAMSEIEVVPSVIVRGNRLMDLRLPDNTLVVMVKRGDKYFIPKGHTRLETCDRLLVISDNDVELRKVYESLGVEEYSMEKN